MPQDDKVTKIKQRLNELTAKIYQLEHGPLGIKSVQQEMSRRQHQRRYALNQLRGFKIIRSTIGTVAPATLFPQPGKKDPITKYSLAQLQSLLVEQKHQLHECQQETDLHQTALKLLKAYYRQQKTARRQQTVHHQSGTKSLQSPALVITNGQPTTVSGAVTVQSRRRHKQRHAPDPPATPAAPLTKQEWQFVVVKKANGTGRKLPANRQQFIAALCKFMNYQLPRKEAGLVFDDLHQLTRMTSADRRAIRTIRDAEFHGWRVRRTSLALRLVFQSNENEQTITFAICRHADTYWPRSERHRT